MNSFEKTSIIDSTIQELFDFHLDIENLKKITPLNIKVELLNKSFLPKEGGILKIKTIKNFIPIIWEVEIVQIKNPNLLVDFALKSPFKYWKHFHIFTKKGNVCELKDIIKYELPFGIKGRFFNSFVQKELNNMFEFRHKMTKKILNPK